MRHLLSLLIALTLITVSTTAQKSLQKSDLNVDEQALALEGYDPVSYFTEKKAVKGKSSIVTEHGQVKYQFSTQKNKDLFLASPSSYKPQYGGYCAYAMGAYGEKVEVDPETPARARLNRV